MTRTPTILKFVGRTGVTPLKRGEAVRRDVLIVDLVRKELNRLVCKRKQVSARWREEGLEWSLTRVLLVASCSPLGRDCSDTSVPLGGSRAFPKQACLPGSPAGSGRSDPRVLEGVEGERSPGDPLSRRGKDGEIRRGLT